MLNSIEIAPQVPEKPEESVGEEGGKSPIEE